MKLTHYHNACLKIEAGGVSILCDPWFSSAYYGTWKPAKHFDNPIETIGPVDFIWISHIHPDHYDPSFLHAYQVRYGSPVLCPDRYVKAACESEGISWVNTSSFKVVIVTSRMYDIDHALVMKDGDEVFVNINDVIFDEKTAKEIKDLYGYVTTVMVPYNGAGSYPQCWMEPQKALSEKDRVLGLMRQRTQAWVDFLQPQTAYLGAGEYNLVGPLAALNSLRAVETAEEACEHISGVRPFPIHPDARPTTIDADEDYLWVDDYGFYDFAGSLEELFGRAFCNASELAKKSYAFNVGGKRLGLKDAPIQIYIDRRLFRGLLINNYNWADAEIGSCFFARRKGEFSREVMDSLSTFHI